MDLSSGRVVAGRYRLDRLLGQGGMGAVWAATHLVTRRSVAMKFLLSSLHGRSDMRRRFLREARAVALVQHPNVVEIFDVFELENDLPVMVMSLLKGETLGARLARETTLPLADVCDIMLRVVSAVGTCHAAGVVHRDLKPDNVFLVAGGSELQVKVLDFGVAKLAAGSGEDATLTGTGAMLGTPCYMAPEQGFGERDIDHRADIWSIGAMMYEALSGGRPVEGENLGQVLKRFMTEGVTPIGALLPDLPEEIQTLIMRMLSREREERPPDLREVHAVLARHARVQAPGFEAPDSSVAAVEPEPQSPTISLASVLVERVDTATNHSLSIASRKSRGKTYAALALGFAVVAIVVARFVTAPAPVANPAAAAPLALEGTSKVTLVPTAGTTPMPSAEPSTLPAPAAAVSPRARTLARDPLKTAPAASGAPRDARAAALPVASAPPVAPAPPAKDGLYEEPPF